MKLLINADDFGLSHEKNIAIHRMMTEGKCTKCSLVVNAEATEEAVQMARDGGYTDRCSLHINLTCGQAITEDIKAVDLYYDSEKNQFRNCHIIRKYKQILPFHIRALRKEIEGQIAKYKGFGFENLSIDSHNWVHLRLPVWFALKPLLKKYHVLFVRPMWSGYHWPRVASKRWSRYFRWVEHILHREKRYRVVGYSSNIEQFLLVQHELQAGIAEVFVHPELVDGKIMDQSSSYEGRPKITVDEAVQMIKNVEIVSQNDLMKEGGK